MCLYHCKNEIGIMIGNQIYRFNNNKKVMGVLKYQPVYVYLPETDILGPSDIFSKSASSWKIMLC